MEPCSSILLYTGIRSVGKGLRIGRSSSEIDLPWNDGWICRQPDIISVSLSANSDLSIVFERTCRHCSSTFSRPVIFFSSRWSTPSLLTILHDLKRVYHSWELLFSASRSLQRSSWYRNRSSRSLSNSGVTAGNGA